SRIRYEALGANNRKLLGGAGNREECPCCGPFRNRGVLVKPADCKEVWEDDKRQILVGHSSSLLKHELNREPRQKSAEQPPLYPLPRRLSLQTRRDDAGCKDDEKVAYRAHGDMDQPKGDALRQNTSPHRSNKLR